MLLPVKSDGSLIWGSSPSDLAADTNLSLVSVDTDPPTTSEARTAFSDSPCHPLTQPPLEPNVPAGPVIPEPLHGRARHQLQRQPDARAPLGPERGAPPAGLPVRQLPSLEYLRVRPAREPDEVRRSQPLTPSRLRSLTTLRLAIGSTRAAGFAFRVSSTEATCSATTTPSWARPTLATGRPSERAGKRAVSSSSAYACRPHASPPPLAPAPGIP